MFSLYLEFLFTMFVFALCCIDARHGLNIYRASKIRDLHDYLPEKVNLGKNV